MSPPTAPAVATVTVTPAAPSVVVGGTTQLDAVVQDAEGNTLTRDVTWSSASNSTATVSATGLVTAVATGTVKITATSESKFGEATVTVTQVPVASVVLSTVSTLVPGQPATLTAETRSAGGATLTGRTVTWSSSANSVATVDANGAITAVGVGTATITATSEGKSADATVTVRDGGWVTPAGGQVDAAGGDVRIVVPAQAVAQAMALTVDAVATPPAHPRLVPNTAYDLGPDGTTFATPVTVSISYDELPAGFSAAQLQIHRWNGTAWQALESTVNTATSTVSAQTASFSIYAIIEVPVPVSSVVITPEAETLGEGETVQLAASVRGPDNQVLTDRTVTWTTSDETVATVSASGLVTGVAAGGPVTITATSEGIDGTATITVESDAPAPLFVSVATGRYHTCGLTATGVALCFGANAECELGTGACGDDETRPVPVNTALRFETIAPGDGYTCALTEAGKAWCWGHGEDGQLGHDSYNNAMTPVAVSGAHVFNSITAGYGHTCALTENGVAWCWGNNSDGQIGDGVAGNPNEPVQVVGGHTFQWIGAGAEHTCGLTTAGAALCWGENVDGELGNGSTLDSDVPVPVSGGHVFAQLAVGEWHTCGVTTQNVALCWGWNQEGQVGDGSTIDNRSDKVVPTPVTGGHAFTRVYPSGWSTCGLLASGAALCWGENEEGEFGNGTRNSSSTPTPVSGGHLFTSLTSGLAYHYCGKRIDNQFLCWGWNEDGQLGDGTFTDQLVPTLLPVLGGASVANADGSGSSSMSASRLGRSSKIKPGVRRQPEVRVLRRR